MNKQDFLETCLGLIIGFIVYLVVSFTLREFNITKWPLISRVMWFLASIGTYLSVNIEWEDRGEDES